MFGGEIGAGTDFSLGPSGFPLSVSFRQFSILTHLPPTLYYLSIDRGLDNSRKRLPEYYGNPGMLLYTLVLILGKKLSVRALPSYLFNP
jgi:hypothetical protein